MKILRCIGLVLILPGCFAAPYPSSPTNLTANDIVGTYNGLFPYGRVSMVLNKNGTFQQSMNHKNGKVYKGSGKWSLSKDADGEQYINLDGEICILDSGNQGACSGSYPLDDSGGAVGIITDLDQQLYYAKAKK